MRLAITLIMAFVLGCAPSEDCDTGYRTLFRLVGAKLNEGEQKQIYAALELKQSADGSSFIQDGCDPADFDVEVKDINGDGVLEVFVQGGNICTSGIAGSSLWLFTKSWWGGYRKNFGFPAGGYKILPEMTKGFPDIQIQGPGFCEPVWRWDGQAYAHQRNVPTSEGGCDHVR